MSRVIPPGSTLGVLGSGQLGRMFTIAARRLGYRVHVFSPDDDTPTGQVADEEIRGDYADLDAVAQFARDVNVITFEFENVPAATAEVAAKSAPVRPGGHVLQVTQNRLREKTALQQAGLPVTRFEAVHSAEELAASVATFPEQSAAVAVLKTASWGYDGKGQTLVHANDNFAGIWSQLNTDEAILEGFVDFECELSVVGARGLDGQFVDYGPIANSHSHHILDVSFAPAKVNERVAADAREIARTVFEKLDVVGVLCVEFFLTRDGKLLINELAPRPHNSGHLTIDGHVTCQFEQQVRAICGLPLGSTRAHGPVAMANLLGDLWERQTPHWDRALASSEVKLHLYGKQEARKGRKMGHLTALADTVDTAVERVCAARDALTKP